MLVSALAPPSLLRDDYLAAILATDATRARHLVEHALDEGMDVTTLYVHVLAPALEEVGVLWETGHASIALEHYATAVTRGIVGAVGPRMRVQPVTGRLAVLACTPGEQHDLGVQMVGDVLEGIGWEVLQLGASLPAGSLAELAAAEQADVVGLSTANQSWLPGVTEAIGELALLEPRPFVVVGGRAWRDAPAGLAERCGADACVTDPAEFAQLLAERFPPVPDDLLD